MPSLPGVANKIARPNILSLTPYRCARDDYDSGVLLDANENSLGPSAVPPGDDDVNRLVLERYPCPYQKQLKSLYCSYRNVGATSGLMPENVFVGVGSDEAIDLLMRIFCAPGATEGRGDGVITTPPTYGMYGVCAKTNDINVIKVPLTESFDVVVDDILAAERAAEGRCKMIFVCSPGNPTCKAIPLEEVIKISEAVGDRCLVVVDEAYIDFCVSDDGTVVGSATSLIGKYPNVVVLQTLSKAFGLAGIRCGFAIASPDVIQLMNNVKAPYNVNKLTSEVACRALSEEGVASLRVKVSKLIEQRAVMAEALRNLDFVLKVHPSDSNFLLFQMARKAKEIYKTMADRGVVTRYRGTELHCPECIRVTIGTPEENVTFLQELKKAWDDIGLSS
mmetsp:Transcript_18635/g.42590  ORF Transcript_18635/g.42590 Transcript_18635/m.42590 type:complete len:392 (-) Transcript_18635:364-1539(-)|eukprot:CAMPEP_0113307182 /NCGR_PEP_ID=MMETSP0010_2-20120614/6130_1 /TAXON_ID=216773 ORGANISM="Corethron hystrix, Strain 308" /NCGR_SAMPLE_ID=MMETSP0010_2 /ASSEMBLY_ACC=CAM_ASM_000155 /LENGTH=391 /DNA_ID=CAMNT_0000161987 /DNA_START=35 /DNA_END=1210 /DNA_ORIENTATION=- /assembly_acc=CAM_ASM_000155